MVINKIVNPLNTSSEIRRSLVIGFGVNFWGIIF
jgi:hypothetical protein